MKRLWPRSLFARLMLIWLFGILLVLAVSIGIFVEVRERAIFEGIAQEIASNADLLDSLGPDERQRSLEQHGRGRLRLSLRLPRHAQPLTGDHPLLAVLREAMPERQPSLYTRGSEDESRPSRQYAPLVIGVKLTDGTLLTARLPGRQPSIFTHASHVYTPVLASALLALLVGVGLLTWLCVRIATRPLLKLSAAAHALGEDPERPPLEASGPIEVIQATEAFNHMQQRIAAHMHERTRILAAISHDLQTPITRLRLRAEMVDDDTLKTRIQSDLDAMQSLIREGLDYARSMEVSAPPQPIDLNGLLAALCGDATDMGWNVSVTGQASAPFTGHAVALRRALWNLIENGVKFGQIVDITLTESPEAFCILIRDHGSGLPPEEIERVFEPFYRTESSRSRETGGTGLGLAITRNLLHVQRGGVSLANHPEGGLAATVTLPRET
jgi:protein-histidine pros-kinase